MATFKVGDRVRIIARWRYGREATIIRPLKASCRFGDPDNRTGWGWHLAVDGCGTIGKRGLPIMYFSDELAPLTDPKADAFLESIKRLKPYSEPLHRKQEAFIEKIESVVGPLGPRFR